MYRVQNSLLERYPSRQPVQKRVSSQGEVENSPKAHAFVDFDDFEHFVRPETGQVAVFGKASSDMDVRL